MMTKQDMQHLWEVAFDSKIWAEDAIELAKAGFPHGYKKGAVEAKLRDAEKALAILDPHVD